MPQPFRGVYKKRNVGLVYTRGGYMATQHTSLMLDYEKETGLDALCGWDGSIELDYIWWLEKKVEELKEKGYDQEQKDNN